MSDHDDQLTALDHRARSAATGLHAQAADRPVPAFDHDQAALGEVTPLPSRRNGNRGRVLAVAAVVLVLAAIAGLLATRSKDDGDDKARVISTDPRPFVAGDLPKGFALAGVGEITDDQRQASAEAGGHVIDGPTTVYGPSDDGPQLAITAGGVNEGWTSDGSTGDIDLGHGRTAHRYDGMGLGKRAWLVIDGDRSLMIVTPALDEEQLRDLAGRATAGADGAIDLHGFDLPSGWHELERFDDASGLTSTLMTMANPGAVGRYATYLQGRGSTSSGVSGSKSESGSDPGSAPEPDLPTEIGMLMVASTPGDELQLHLGVVAADSARTATVRGHDAVITEAKFAPDAGDPMVLRAVAWLEAPGEMVKVSGVGISEEELLATAEGVEPVGKAEWKDLIERSQLGGFDPANDGEGQPVKVGEGTFADGSHWLLGARPPSGSEAPDPTVTLSVDVANPGQQPSSGSSGGSGSEGADPTAIVATEVVQSGAKSFLGALVGTQVGRIELQDGDGSVLATPEVVEGNGFRGVAVAIPDGRSDLVAFAADGTELARTQVRIGDTCDEGGSPSTGDEDATTATTEPILHLCSDGTGQEIGTGN